MDASREVLLHHFQAGLARKPDMIGADMGSIDIGPTYLGKGEMATSPESTRRDLRRVLTAARAAAQSVKKRTLPRSGCRAAQDGRQ